jgi:hydroxymethylbilane synthase
LPAGAVVGTSSLRRQALLRAERPDLRLLPLRGNVDTRLRKLEEGVCDGLVMARAGLNRLGLSPANAEALAPASFVPAVGQGIIGLEARAEDAELLELLRRVDHTETHMQARAERAFLLALGADCHTPVAGWARTERDSLVLTGLVASIDGARVLRGVGRGPVTEAEAVGRRLGEELLARGADDLLRAAGGAPRPGANSSV